MNRFGKKLFLWMLALTMALGAAVLGLPDGRAHADWNNPVVFSSTFQNDSMAGWTVNRPTWSIGNASGQYWLRTTAEAGENIAWAGQSHWSRYAVESKVRIEHPLGNGGILFRVTDANNFYLFRLNLATGKAELYKKTAGQLVLVKDAAYGASANVWYTLKAEVKRNEVHG
ncbi:hypothetical protein FE782_31235 [Paenibacillus antri]|uniref:DUF1080 domain-containing protein n=1 Tax=Paenibacillus antri TaxID=2582848 RepID=A0A5R9G2G0_9BACL|nr:hypothetical protein [Paenibacillus antri]TLS48340.1 hypothetical protein FE782_31235 [Paenibacillus antri]